MKNVAFAIIVAGTAMMGSSQSAVAYDYPYCLQGRGIGIPGECLYQTYEQCLASASGRALTCNINPRVAFGQQQRRERIVPRY